MTTILTAAGLWFAWSVIVSAIVLVVANVRRNP